jgi:hypothetical protein
VVGDLFQLLGVRMERGRGFAAADGAGAALVLAVVLTATMSLLRLRARRAAARALLRSRDARLSHTQYHIHESVHSFIDARVDVVNTRQPVGA